MIKNLFYFFAYWSGFNYIYSLFLDKKVFLVMYHSISSEKNSNELRRDLYEHISIDEKTFESHIKYMKDHGHTFITFDDLATPDFRTIKKPTIVYFDDGFKDVLLNAKPILEKYNVPATVFLVTGILDRFYMIWTILLKEALTKQGVPLSDQKARIEAIKMQNDASRIEYMKQFSTHEYESLFDLFLSWDEVRKLGASQFQFGSHSVSHPRITECSPEAVKEEMESSKSRIEQETGKIVSAFSFPHGRGSGVLVDELGKHGYQYAVSAGKGLNSVPVKRDGVAYFRNISPKPKESLQKFALRLYALNIKE